MPENIMPFACETLNVGRKNAQIHCFISSLFLMHFGLMSGHLLSIQKLFLTYGTCKWKDIIVSLHVLLPIFLEVHFKCFTMFTGIHGFVVCGHMYFKVSLPHKLPVAVLGHTFISFYCLVYYLVLV